MRIQVSCWSLFVVATVASVVSGQDVQEPPVAPPLDAAERRVVFQPVARVANRPPSLNDLVLAKVDLSKEAPKVIMMIESYRTEKKKVKVTTIKQEVREREVKVGDETVTQKFTVNVPVTEEREVNTQVPAGRKPVSLDTKDVGFLNLDGEVVSIDDAGKILTKLHPVFLLDRGAQPMPLPAIVKQALRDDCLIAVTTRVVRQKQNAAWRGPVGIRALAPAAVPVP